MMKLLKKIKTNEEGASAAEYALMIALVGGLIIIAATTLSGGISKVFAGMGSTLSTGATAIQAP